MNEDPRLRDDGHQDACSWPQYHEAPPGTSFWGELSYDWSMVFCQKCKADPANKRPAPPAPPTILDRIRGWFGGLK